MLFPRTLTFPVSVRNIFSPQRAPGVQTSPKIWQWYLRSLSLGPLSQFTLSTGLCSSADFWICLLSPAPVAGRVRSVYAGSSHETMGFNTDWEAER